MKKTVVALVAFCIAGMASAIATGWTTVSDTQSISSATSWTWASNQVKNGASYAGGASFAIRVTFTDVTLKDSQVNWAAFLGIQSGNDNYSFQNSNGGLWVTGGDVVKSDFFSWEGSSNISLTFVYDHAAQTLSFYLGDELLRTAAGVNINAWVTFGVGSDGKSNRPLDRVFSGGSYKVEFTDDIGLVPEPTVLAFLALGVAGLALRRKVA